MLQTSLRDYISTRTLYSSLGETPEQEHGEGVSRIKLSDRDPRTWPSDCATLPTDILARKNPFPQDRRIRFVEQTHKYYIDGVEAPTSTTSIVHAPFPAFDTKARAQAAVGSSKYPGKNAREIARLWKQKGVIASQHGTTMHAAIEVALNTGYWSKDPRIQTELSMAKDFMRKEIEARGLEIFRTEPTIFVDPKRSPGGFMLPGSVDCLCKDPKTNHLWIFDWKRVQGLENASAGGNFGWGLHPPFSKWENTKVSHYSLQLHVYRHILVHYYGFIVPKENLYMVAFHPCYPTYLMVQALDLEEEVNHIMANFSQYLEIARQHQNHEQAIETWLSETVG